MMKGGAVLWMLLVLAMLGAAVWWWLPGDRRAELWADGRELLQQLPGARMDDDDDDDDDDRDASVVLLDGVPAVQLAVEVQRHSGLRIAALAPHQFRDEATATARVLDIQPLLELRARYSAAQAALALVQPELRAARQEVERLRILHREQTGVSTRQLQQAELKLETSQAQVMAAERQLVHMREEAVQTWDAPLVDWALGPESELFRRLLSRQEALLLATLPPGVHLPEEAAFVYVGLHGERLQARKGYVISPAPTTEPTVQGETWFLRTPATRLRVGMRVDVWVPQGDTTVGGVRIPGEAVVWYAGKPWAYVQVDEEHFLRRPLEAARRLGEDWFVAEGFQAEEMVVVSGGQMLLSEEFRAQIPDEDDD